MDRVSKLVALAVLATSGTVHAGYAQLAPPAGFSGTSGAWTFAPSANQASYGNVLHHPGALRVPVPGTAATMPASYRLAANAPRIAAAAVFMNPYVRVGVGIATWLGVAGIVWDAVNNRWARQDESSILSDGNTYSMGTITRYSAEDVCKTYVSGLTDWKYTRVGTEGAYTYCYYENIYNSSNTAQTQIYIGSSQCPVGWYVTPAGCVQNAPLITVTKPEFEDILAPKPMPETVPFEIPRPTPLPVEQPVINPEPGPNPQPRPLFVPTGDPVQNPQYDPNSAPSPENQPWLQPGVRVVPSPTPLEPLRVDLKPINKPVPGPQPMLEPVPETYPYAPAGQTPNDFCANNPDVLACQKLDEPNSEELPASEKQISISPDSGWGADNASCPAPKQITVQGRAIPIPFDLFCTWATGMRPIIIAMAWLSAAFILLGARNES